MIIFQQFAHGFNLKIKKNGFTARFWVRESRFVSVCVCVCLRVPACVLIKQPKLFFQQKIQFQSDVQLLVNLILHKEVTYHSKREY